MQRRLVTTVVLALSVGLGATAAVDEDVSTLGAFGPSGSLAEARWGHTATLLLDGRVLAAGGIGAEGASPLASAEAWDPATGEFTSLTTMLTEARFLHTATLLSDGRVLLVGGGLATAELWDPATGEFERTDAMTSARASHTATLLDDGRVLIVGGDSAGVWVAAEEIWDPATGEFTETGSLGQPRDSHTATLLDDGRVLIVGGLAGIDSGSMLGSAEIWDPATGEFTETGSLGQPRGYHTATRLDDGQVLVVGGFCGYYCPLQTEAWAWSPETEAFTLAGSLVEARATHSATLLPDGRVLIVGGKDWWDRNGSFGFIDVWEPATGEFIPAGGLTEPRGFHTATSMPDGRVIVIGGDGASGVRALAEVWNPGAAATPES
jgi:WD40 repeat protein